MQLGLVKYSGSTTFLSKGKVLSEWLMDCCGAQIIDNVEVEEKASVVVGRHFERWRTPVLVNFIELLQCNRGISQKSKQLIRTSSMQVSSSPLPIPPAPRPSRYTFNQQSHPTAHPASERVQRAPRYARTHTHMQSFVYGFFIVRGNSALPRPLHWLHHCHYIHLVV